MNGPCDNRVYPNYMNCSIRNKCSRTELGSSVDARIAGQEGQGVA